MFTIDSKMFDVNKFKIPINICVGFFLRDISCSLTSKCSDVIKSLCISDNLSKK